MPKLNSDQSNAAEKHLWIGKMVGKRFENHDTKKFPIDGCGVYSYSV